MKAIPRSTRLTYRTLPDHIRTHEELTARAAELLATVEKGELIRVGGRYPPAQAARAARALRQPGADVAADNLREWALKQDQFVRG